MKNRSDENGNGTPTADCTMTMPDGAVQIEYCSRHYEELKMSLLQRNMSDLVSTTQAELIEKLVGGGMDPMLEMSNAITGAALQTFGPESIMANGGCPLCAFENIIDHVADHMAIKYRKSN